MSQVYNYMMEYLPINRKVRYPVNNRSELKKIYEEIVNLSKSSPFYKLNLSKENQEYTIGVKETALALKAKILELSDPLESDFKSKEIAVSDDSILTASLINDQTDNLPAIIEFVVGEVAKPQVNQGKELFLPARNLPTGEYNFSARVGDNTYELTFKLESRTDNQKLLERMADLINHSVPGITASVEDCALNNYKYLRIETDKIGRYGDKKFLFEDSHFNTINIVEYFGLNRVVQPSSWASISLNGVSKQVSTNIFTLENTLRITLQKDSDKTVILKVVPDKKKVLTSVEAFLETYNDLIGLAQDRTLNSEEHYKANRLLCEMNHMEEIYQEELRACGILRQTEGTLVLDDSLAVQAVEDGGMEQLFTRNNGFITRLLHKAETIAINPLEYLDKTIVTYPNTDKIQFRNSYVTSMYSGLFFNSYC